MGKSIFILDRPDFARYTEILPADKERARLETQLRTAREEYQAHLHREGTLAAEIASVSREMGRRSDPDLANRLGCLIAQREVWPEIMQESAEAFAQAIAAWAGATWRAFDAVYREADDAATAEAPEFQNLVRRQNGIRRNDDPKHARINARIAEIQRRARPHIETRQLAHQGRAAVQAALNMTLGGHSIECRVSERDIARFVDRHHSRSIAA